MSFWRRQGGPLVLMSLMALPLAAADQGMRWRWSNPTPHGNNVVDMAYSPELEMAVQVTERGQIYISRDFKTWMPRESGTRLALRTTAFLGVRLIIAGEAGTVLYADSATAVRNGVLVDGPTQDWLEGAATSAERAVLVGDNGAIYTSADGIVWQRQNSGTTAWLRGAAHGVGTFVAVGENGTVLRSTDGTSWSIVESGVTSHLNRVTHTGSVFIATGDAGVVLVSADGGQWTAETSGATGDLLGIGGNSSTQLVVGDEELRRLEDNQWFNELQADPAPPPWPYYSVLATTNEMLVAGQTGLIARADRTVTSNWSWSTESPSVRSWLFDMTHVPGLFVAVGDRGTVMTSSRGVTWDLEAVPDALTNSVLLGVGGTTNMLIAAGNQGSLMISPNVPMQTVWTNESGIVVTQEVSSLGVLWQAVEPRPATNDLQGVTYHNGRYYVSGDKGLILSTSDGVEWTQHQTPSSTLLSGIAGFPGGLVATGDDGAMVFSSDGHNWEALPTLTTNWLFRVRHLNGSLFAIGQEGTIFQSLDGRTWEPRTSGVSQWLNDVSWVKDRYYIAGARGTLLSSADGSNWTNAGGITPKTLFALATDHLYLITAGIEGVILRSPIVPDLTPVSILEFSRVFTQGETAYRNLFLLGGRIDQRFTFDFRQSLEDGDWTTGPMIEFTDDSGTLYYIETVSSTNASASEYYRATLVP